MVSTSWLCVESAIHRCKESATVFSALVDSVVSGSSAASSSPKTAFINGSLVSAIIKTKTNDSMNMTVFFLIALFYKMQRYLFIFRMKNEA